MLNPDADLDLQDNHWSERTTLPEIDPGALSAPRRHWLVEAADTIGRGLRFAWRIAWGRP